MIRPVLQLNIAESAKAIRQFLGQVYYIKDFVRVKNMLSYS